MRIHEGRNIHQHLDLIVGLPYEDIQSFRKSFCDVYDMKPDQLQVGFLKVLKGSPIQMQAEEFGIVHQSVPPYEVLYTRWISYDEVRELKLVEEMVERYYNSMQFQAVLSYLVPQAGDAFAFYSMLGEYFKKKGYFGLQQSRLQNYEILYEFAEELCFHCKAVCEEGKEDAFEEKMQLLKELFIFDLYARENLKKEPAFLQNRELHAKQKEWLRAFYQREEAERKYLHSYQGYSWKQMLRMTHVEWFSYDIPAFVENGMLEKRDTIVLFDYKRRNPLDYQAATIKISR